MYIQGGPKVGIQQLFFFFTGIVNDGRELKYRTKKVDFEGILENCIPTFGPPCIMCVHYTRWAKSRYTVFQHSFKIHFLCSILKFPAIIHNTCKEKITVYLLLAHPV
jgi:hypothetical protein